MALVLQGSSYRNAAETRHKASVGSRARLNWGFIAALLVSAGIWGGIVAALS